MTFRHITEQRAGGPPRHAPGDTPKGSIAEQRAAAYGGHGTRGAAVIPSGAARTHAFPSEIRSKVVARDGQKYLEVEGYASTFGQGYEMWDMFGTYTEQMASDAFDKSLAAGPDVAFLINHKGLTMARSIPGRNGTPPTLELYADETGLGTHAFLNVNRQDVRDFQSALDDGLITEMSFAFMLNDGRWSEDFTQFTITEADIDRGDVSGVNYGANPHTSITARAADVLADLRRMPAAVKAEARRIASVRKQLRADGDEDAGTIATAIDAALDEACNLIEGIDLSVLPAEVGQALGLMTSAEVSADQLMEVMGLYDADDAGTMMGAPAKPAAPPARAPATGTSLTLLRARMLADQG